MAQTLSALCSGKITILLADQGTLINTTSEIIAKCHNKNKFL